MKSHEIEFQEIWTGAAVGLTTWTISALRSFSVRRLRLSSLLFRFSYRYRRGGEQGCHTSASVYVTGVET